MVAVVFFVAAGGWLAVVQAERSDTDRCRVISGATAQSVSGGWGKPDVCSYVDDETRELVYPDGRFAGPVETTPARDAAAIGVAIALLLLGTLVANAQIVRRHQTVV